MLQEYDIVMIYNVYISDSNLTMIIIEHISDSNSLTDKITVFILLVCEL